jgi:hypothetical protein
MSIIYLLLGFPIFCKFVIFLHQFKQDEILKKNPMEFKKAYELRLYLDALMELIKQRKYKK